ncbi:MAG: hypothetical protein IPK75_18940 [Acidobacteria bacterium]|nr:hypothetical protein [Acidobacteriota bacterium]
MLPMLAMAAIPAATGLLGAFMGSQANSAAAKTQKKALRQQQEQQRIAQQRFEQMQVETAPARARMQQLAGSDPNQLTAEQKIALRDQSRQAVNMLGMSGLRGSGRAQSGVLSRVRGDAIARYTSENARRSDVAAGALTGQYYNAGDKVAGMDLAQGQTYADIGGVDAQKTVANAQLWGQALGAVGGAASGGLKDYMRQSGRYADYTVRTI